MALCALAASLIAASIRAYSAFSNDYDCFTLTSLGFRVKTIGRHMTKNTNNSLRPTFSYL